ncbi:phosphotransferase [Streptomyces avicenniae]|uniref:phosphotransferase n=1 Tax=Streptomyces avicenniae TaxID=500153 RepID=UPI00069A00F3|nr:phosphotransferase [Streptomyces avicenniae]
MRHRPSDIPDSALCAALSAWGLEHPTPTWVPAGFGDHHWTVTTGDGRRWFVTVADLSDKPHCGPDVQGALLGLRRAMDTAYALRALPFVVAPLRTADGATVAPLGERYCVSVFPFVAGDPGQFCEARTPHERRLVLDLLAALHSTPPPPGIPHHTPAPPGRAVLDAALDATDIPWAGGPYAEPARALTARHAPALRAVLEAFDRQAARPSGAPVVTHGEPHPGNILRAGDRRLLIDWDTTALAPPERDLWLVADGPDDLAYYARATGHTPDQDLLAFHRLRWDLDDTAAFLGWFRAPHTDNPDTAQAWEGLRATLARLTSPAGDGA